MTGPGRVTGAGPVTDPGPVTGPPAQTSFAPAADRGLPVARTPFILLVLALLGGGLICLLVINTTLATGSFEITHLQQGNVTMTQREQSLRQQLASEGSTANIEKQAVRLGMRQQHRLNFINPRTGRIYRQPATEPGVTTVPGYYP